jgi:histidinol-phosphate aminotransferase
MSYEYERVVAPADALRLHLNENTAGCSPKVIEALRRLTPEIVATYPDYDGVIAACASRLGVDAGRVLLTNGLDDGILAAAVWTLRGSPPADPFEAIVVVPAFDMYAACVEAAGGRVIEVPLGPEFVFPLERLLDAVTPRTRAIFITNPNNPTGSVVGKEDVLTVALAVPRALVFVDEAYADFSDGTLIGDARFSELPNLVVGRTFAKAYGLAGLRAGVLVGSPAALAPLRRTVPPYTLNVASMLALPAAFDDVEYYEWYLDQVRQSKALLIGLLDRRRVKYWPSAANFLLVRFGPDLDRVINGLAARGIAIRDRSGDPGCAGCARITTGVLEHTRRCVEALEEILCDAE